MVIFKLKKATSTDPAALAATAFQLPADASFIPTKSKETSCFDQFRNIFSTFQKGILEPPTSRAAHFPIRVNFEKILKVKKPNHQFKEPTVAPGDNRPSVYNRRISSEQIELPDGRICTRVPARKWSKVKTCPF